MQNGTRIWLQWLAMALTVTFSMVTGQYFKPFNVSYDHRALIIDGQRRMLVSAGIHYPRATPEMWPDLIAKSKEGGADVIETYVFWSGHEPVKGQVCWGFPVWLRDIPGIVFRTDNEPFKEEMQRFVKKIVDVMREESLFSWQGGPIIMLQIENEYGNIEDSYGQKGKDYMNWAANMAVGLGAGVPWVMCRQTDAPENIIDACNGYYCDGYTPNSKKKPVIWTENWDGWYTSWGGRLPHRPVEDLAFAVARFYQRGGSFQNYYMFFGGTNFGRTSGGPNYITSYDYDAPIDEYGLLHQPKWGHLKDLHAALKLCEPALVAADSAQYIKLGPRQEAHVYRGNNSTCSAFLANIDEHKESSVQFLGQAYTLPPWSVSILPDCRNTAFNTAKVGAQTSIKVVDFESTSSAKISAPEHLMIQKGVPLVSESWMSFKEPIGVWGDDNFTVQGILEHLNVTKDQSDYLWYITRIYVSDEEIAFWKENAISPSLTIDSMRDLVHIFINGQLIGSAWGDWIKVAQQVQFKQGYNDVMLLSETVGLQNYGAFLEKDGAGFKGQITLTGFKNGDVNLTYSPWTYQVGLKGEFLKLYAVDNNGSSDWTNLAQNEVPSTFSWYKTYFDSPGGKDPVVLDMSSMGKGQAWVNGHHIGRYWTLVAPKDGCQETCDYRGSYDSEKCNTNCGKPTQIWYHVPRSWLQPSDNLLVLFEETGGNPLEISVKTVTVETVCAHMSEYHNPPLQMWSHPNYFNGELSASEMKPVMQLQCEDGYTIASIEFASYGTPQGSCQAFSMGKCHAPNSASILSKACEGRNSCKIEVSNSVFGDPCPRTVKTLAVEARCKPSSSLYAGVSDI
ncbi:beta-galactosidase 9 isoform X2 [Cynara cardunculus var. scolymus]|uniref:beta-galactosidase 9 isoform X2 n=1 Tax=Cynara cardunculus var. scolymus TaxID=59895 RepID=UPI000D6266C8|nr:beta-galactosidase 9 isoform X2 [Cynara cardunculus var. scolymus]